MLIMSISSFAIPLPHTPSLAIPFINHGVIMNRRIILLASILFAAVAFSFGSTTSAQADTCCVRIHNRTLQCHAVICIWLSNSNSRCVDIPAGQDSAFRFLCNDSTAFTVNDVCGVPHRLILNQRVRVPLRGGCCAHVVLRQINGCYDIEIVDTDSECSCGGLE